MLKSQKIIAGWVVILALALSPSFSFAGSTPLSAPLVPAQNPGLSTPEEADQAISQNIEVTQIQGTVFSKKRSSDDFQSLQNGAKIFRGDFIKTNEGSCHLILNGKDDLFLGPNTSLKIEEASRNEIEKTNATLITMESGRLKATLAKLKKGSTFRVEAPTAIAAVRGTTFYLNVGNFMGKNAAQLFVEKSHGGVLFKNKSSGESFLVPAFSLSTSFADGRLNEPQRLSSEQQEIFIKNWQNPDSTSAQQFGIEEIPNPNATGATNPLNQVLPETKFDFKTDDAAQDKISEQNIPGANGLPVENETVTEPQTEHEASPEEQALADQEKAMIRREIARIREDQDFDHADANLAQVADAQTGKVFVDVFGNRVRVDQYVFHEPDSDTVQLLSLTARTGEYQNGVSAVLFGTQFNRGIGGDVDLKTLPWNDYMNVVKREEVAAAMGISQDSPEYHDLYSEYIVHEHAPGLARGDSAFFPTHFFAQFTNPIGDRAGQDIVRFDDFYTDPFTLKLETGDGLQSFVAQGKDIDTILVLPFGGQGVIQINEHLTGEDNLNPPPGDYNTPPLFPVEFEEHDDDNGSQTTTFAVNFNPAGLLDINYYKNLAINDDGNPTNDDHPAYFHEKFGERLGVDDEVIGSNHLIGLFIPINDQGQIFNQPGFQVRGLRDLFNPNPLVNGGNYNLEVILIYGYDDNLNDAELGLHEGFFHEDFRIDAIITPEIFPSFQGIQSHTTSLFPPALHDDEDDTRSLSHPA